MMLLENGDAGIVPLHYSVHCRTDVAQSGDKEAVICDRNELCDRTSFWCNATRLPSILSTISRGLLPPYRHSLRKILLLTHACEAWSRIIMIITDRGDQLLNPALSRQSWQLISHTYQTWHLLIHQHLMSHIMMCEPTLWYVFLRMLVRSLQRELDDT